MDLWRALVPVVLGVPGLACAEPPSGSPAGPAPAARPADPDADALGGPKVAAPTRKDTLVERDFDGRIKRLEVNPVQAGVDLLALDAETRAAVHRVLVERAAIMDRLVEDNLKEIVELATARQAGDNATARGLARVLFAKARPLVARGRVLDEVCDLLPAGEADRLRSLVEAYYAALVDERLGAAAGDDSPKGRQRRGRTAEALGVEMVAAFGLEVRAAYERVFGQRVQDFEALIRELDLTPEQESKVRRLVTDLVQKTYGKPTPAQIAGVFLEIYRELSGEQREVLREKMAERRGATSAPASRESDDAMRPDAERP